MNKKTIPLLLLLMTLGLSVPLVLIPPHAAHATPYTVFVQSATAKCLNSNSCMVNFSSKPVVGDFIVLAWTGLAVECTGTGCDMVGQGTSTSLGSYTSAYVQEGDPLPTTSGTYFRLPNGTFVVSKQVGDAGYFNVTSSVLANALFSSGLTVTMASGTGVNMLAQNVLAVYEVNRPLALSSTIGLSSWWIIGGTFPAGSVYPLTGLGFSSPLTLPPASDVPTATNNTAWIGLSEWTLPGGLNGNASFSKYTDSFTDGTYIAQNTTIIAPSPSTGDFNVDITDSSTNSTSYEFGVGMGFFVDPTPGVTIPIKCTMENSAAPQGTMTVSGGSIAPTSVLCDGVAHGFAAMPNSTITVSTPVDGANSRYRFPGGGTSTTFVSCLSGKCEQENESIYLELDNVWQITATDPPLFSTGLSVSFIGEIAGVGSSTICTISSTTGTSTNSCTNGWSDYGKNVTAPQFLTGAPLWENVANAPTTVGAPTTGGNTFNTDYSRVVSDAVDAGSGAFLYPQTCYSHGYYFDFYVALPAVAPHIVYSSSSTGHSFSATTNITKVSTAPVSPEDGAYGVYCDGSGHVYMAFQNSSTKFTYLEGTSSGGVITFNAPVYLTCTHGSYYCSPVSIFAYSPSAVYIALNSSPSGGTDYLEAWKCTSTCSAGFWSDVYTSDSGNDYAAGIFGLGTNSSSQQMLAIQTSTVLEVLSSYGSYGASRVSTTNDYSIATNGAAAGISCVTGNSTTTLYCAAVKSTGASVYSLKFVSNGIGGGVWTETAIDAINYIQSAAISTDSTNAIISYASVGSGGLETCPCNIYYQTALLSSLSWSGRLTTALGELGTIYMSDAPTMHFRDTGITWLGTDLAGVGTSGIKSRFALAFAMDSDVNVCVDYKLIGGGDYNAPVLSYSQNSSAKTLTLSLAYKCITASAYTIPGMLSGPSATSSERAELINATSGTFTMSGNYTFVYYNQYLNSFNWVLCASASGSTGNPTFYGTQLGSPFSTSLPTTPTGYWLDAGTTWRVTNPWLTDMHEYYASTAGGLINAATGRVLTISYCGAATCTSQDPTVLLEKGCVAGAIFFQWFQIFGPYFIAFLDFLPALAIYLRNESPAMAVTVYVLLDIIFTGAGVYGGLPVTIGTFAPLLIAIVLAGSVFQLLRSNKGG